jgi:hypothetical protein
LLDADDDCPVDLARRVRERARSIIPHQPVSVVVPKREFEAWFLACASSLNNVRGLVVTELPHAYAEDVRGAKEWLGKRMPGGYGDRRSSGLLRPHGLGPGTRQQPLVQETARRLAPVQRPRSSGLTMQRNPSLAQRA